MEPTTEQAVKDQVGTFTVSDAMFTAYDVTKALRHEQGLDVKHFEVRDVVHAMFDNGDMPTHMSRESRSVGSRRTAFVYFPSWRMADTYDPDTLGGSSDPSQGSPTQPSQTTAPPPQSPPQSPPQTIPRDGRELTSEVVSVSPTR